MRQFSTEHLVVLALMTAAIVLVVARPQRLPPKALAVFIGGAYAIDLGTKIVSGDFDWGFDLPLHLSDVVAIFAPVALWTLRPLLVEVLYFWALYIASAAVLALVLISLLDLLARRVSHDPAP